MKYLSLFSLLFCSSVIAFALSYNHKNMDSDKLTFTSLEIQDTTYCTPSFLNGCQYGSMIDDFSLYGEDNTAIINPQTGCASDAYDDRTDEIVHLAPGISYYAEVTHGKISGDNCVIWIDFNDDGEFDESEKVAADRMKQDGVSSIRIDIPASANIGMHRMRVMVAFSAYPYELAPCNEGNYVSTNGEVHDYTVNIVNRPECTGTPNAGAVDVEEISICSEKPFTLSVSGASNPSDFDGFELTWQISPYGKYEWVDVPDSKTAIHTVTEGVTDTVDFRFKVTCIHSGESDTSDITRVIPKHPTECYCIPTYITGCVDWHMIDDFILHGENENSILDRRTGCSLSAYEDRTHLSADLAQDSRYLAEIITWAPALNGAIWIDFTDSGNFELVAHGFIGYGDEGNVPLDIYIPASANPGLHRMRVMIGWGGDPADPQMFTPCNNGLLPRRWGEVHDYMVNIVENENGHTAACSLETEAGMSVEEAISVNQYQRIANILPVDADKDFRLDSFSFYALLDAETKINNIQLSLYKNGDMQPEQQVPSSLEIESINTAKTGEFQGKDRTKITVSIAEPYMFRGNSLETLYWLGMKINHSGGDFLFELSSEADFPFGAFFLRYNGKWKSSADLYGQEMYGIMSYYGDCIDLPLCIENPKPGEATVPEKICSGEALKLDIRGYYSIGASGLSYQWQRKAPEATTWEDIPGATYVPYYLEEGITEKTQFRLVVSCSYSGNSTASWPGEADIKPANQCHCVPEQEEDCEGDFFISYVEINGEQNSLSNSSSCEQIPYSDYYDNSTVDLIAGETYVISIGAETNQEVAGLRVWIDYGNDGTFDESEIIAESEENGLETGISNYEFTVPTGIKTGKYRIRVRLFDESQSEIDACETVTRGETEDYGIRIIDPKDFDGEDCGQEVISDDEVAIGKEEMRTSVIANEFKVNAGEAFTLHSFSFNALIEHHVTIDGNVELYYYEDSNGMPGNLIETQILRPELVEEIGEGMGLKRVKVDVNLAAPMTFTAGSKDKLYWLGIRVEHEEGQIMMELSEALQTEAELYFSHELGSEWISTTEFYGMPMDGVMSFYGKCREIVATVNKKMDTSIRYFPNPTTDILTLEADKLMKRVEIYNLLGQMVHSQQLHGIKSSINIGSLTPGVYLMKVDVSGKVQVLKVMKS